MYDEIQQSNINKEQMEEIINVTKEDENKEITNDKPLEEIKINNKKEKENILMSSEEKQHIIEIEKEAKEEYLEEKINDNKMEEKEEELEEIKIDNDKEKENINTNEGEIEKKKVNKILKYVLIAIGSISFVLGTIGIILPILPTVPFYLLTLICFAKSSDHLHRWFVNSKFYKNNLEDFMNGKGMTIKVKIKTIIVVTILMGIGFFMMKRVLVGRIILAVVWVAHIIIFIFVIKTRKEDKNSNTNELSNDTSFSSSEEDKNSNTNELSNDTNISSNNKL